jgi:hypothetical protein
MADDLEAGSYPLQTFSFTRQFAYPFSKRLNGVPIILFVGENS